MKIFGITFLVAFFPSLVFSRTVSVTANDLCFKTMNECESYKKQLSRLYNQDKIKSELSCSNKSCKGDTVSLKSNLTLDYLFLKNLNFVFPYSTKFQGKAYYKERPFSREDLLQPDRFDAITQKKYMRIKEECQRDLAFVKGMENNSFKIKDFKCDLVISPVDKGQWFDEDWLISVENVDKDGVYYKRDFYLKFFLKGSFVFD